MDTHFQGNGLFEDRIGLIPRSLNPENLEAPITSLNTWLTPNHLFYVRHHLNSPVLSPDTWSLTLDGEVRTPLSFGYNELKLMPQKSMFVTLECSGNKRAFYQPPTPGEQWEIGAIGNAKWTGVTLANLLNKAGLKDSAVEIVFRGSDFGQRPDIVGQFHFERSLPIDKALAAETLLVLSMNDQPLPQKHGFPVRLLVPGWYGMASVKWLDHITALNVLFRGPFQAIDYVYLPQENDYQHATPVTEIKINSMITQPSPGLKIPKGFYTIRGMAWAGKNLISQVEVSTDLGATWSKAKLTTPEHAAFNWTLWEYEWATKIPGKYTIMARAIDNQGNVQPMKAEWNAKGYANNSIHQVNVEVPAPPPTAH